jgi:hypothetical protein
MDGNKVKQQSVAAISAMANIIADESVMRDAISIR